MAVDPAERYLLLQLDNIHLHDGDRLLFALDTRNRDVVAIKQLQLVCRSNPEAMYDHLAAELTNHRALVHPNIAQLRDVFFSVDNYLCVVMEWANMGSLLEHIQSFLKMPAAHNNVMRECKARWFFQQLILALDYMHRKQVAHRNLKLNHLLLKVESGMAGPELKLCDFGMSKHAERHITHTLVPGDQYSSPEVLARKGHVGPEVDVWCAGVILFVLLTGEFPFEQEPQDCDRQSLDDALKRRQERHYQHGLPVGLTDSCRHLLDNMLEVDPRTRYTLEHIKQHSWFLQDWDYSNSSPAAQVAAMNAAFAQNLQRVVNPEMFPPPCERNNGELRALADRAIDIMEQES